MTKNGDKIMKKKQKKRDMLFLQCRPPLIHTEQKKVLLNGVLQICGASAPNETRLHPQRVASYVKIAREGEVVVPLWQNNPALLQFSQFDQLHRVVYHLLVFSHLKSFPTVYKLCHCHGFISPMENNMAVNHHCPALLIQCGQLLSCKGLHILHS